MSDRSSADIASNSDTHQRAMLDRALSGDQKAEHQIFTTYAPRVFQLAYRMTLDTEFAEDITQDTFVRVFSRLHQFRGDARLSTWIHTIAASVTLNAIRKRKGIEQRELSLAHAKDQESPRELGEPDMRARIAQAVGALPPDQRIVLVMHDIEGYAHDEIARTLGIGDGACRMRLTRARETLRSTLAAYRGESR